MVDSCLLFLELSSGSSSMESIKKGIEKHKARVGDNVALFSQELTSQRTTGENRARENNFILLETMLTIRVHATQRRILYQTSES